MNEFDIGDLVYEPASGRTGVIVGEAIGDEETEDVQVTFDWFVEVHWLSVEKNFSETFSLGNEYVLFSSLKLISKS